VCPWAVSWLAVGLLTCALLSAGPECLDRSTAVLPAVPLCKHPQSDEHRRKNLIYTNHKEIYAKEDKVNECGKQN